ncbi:YtxH domain-containing protein [Paenibacillus sp. IHBB 10380]|uniref:YtxH domain-containing protein n=1 Tax=Paenibacillus sp. IHBB 10380 TaxID=1566358 RepID=UPI0005CFB805|nr:YtxH domain-containing protein [Paenibacillus sp. IHBB 10380]AJS59468.1 hypothetical protein UB51_14480 [Paenibacillus sp. IHBB 10380]
MNDKNKSFLWGTLLGSVVGSVTALLLAPKTGSELRKDIVDTTHQVSDKTQQLVGIASEHGINLYDKVRTKTGSLVQDIQTLRHCKGELKGSSEQWAHISSSDDQLGIDSVDDDKVDSEI